jgi:GT2 family glycosyltransferase
LAEKGYNKPLFSVIVINYNGKSLLARFLPSIANLDYENLEVIIVDNASTDNSVRFLKKNYPNFKVIESPQNFGTAEGSNLGLPNAKGDYILWLSNDMELDASLLRYMVETAESSPEIGICTCKMRRITGQGEKLNIIDSVGADADIFGFPSARGINEPDKGQLDETSDVFFSFGGAMLIKREVIKKIGVYDSTFFTLADDIDLCWRAHLAGYRVIAQPKALLYHRVSATLGTTFGRSKKRYLSEKNTFRMLLKNYSTSTLAKTIPLYLGILMAEIILFTSLRKFRIVNAYIQAVLWNIRNFKDTWTQHVKVQQMRVISDKGIRKMMYKGSFKIKILKEFLKTRCSKSWQAYFGEPIDP